MLAPILRTAVFASLAACAASQPPSLQTSCPTQQSGPDSARAALDVAAVKIVAALNAGDGEALVGLFAARMRDEFPLAKTGPFARRVRSSKGVLSAPVRANAPSDRLHGTYRVKAERGDWLLDIHLDEAGAVTGMRITEAQPEPEVVRSAVSMNWPVRGRWFVVWGGDRADLNHHTSAPSQRRAMDLTVKGEDGRTFRSDGKENQDFFAYGKEVLAAADGDVETVVDGIPENAPGTLNPYFAPGNLVVVRHSPSLYSAYAHLQPGRMRAIVGAKVRRGDVLGLCGNSGNSTEPHLHFQLQDGPRFESSWGVEAVFEGVIVTHEGVSVRSDHYVPRQGDFVEAAGQ